MTKVTAGSGGKLAATNHAVVEPFADAPLGSTKFTGTTYTCVLGDHARLKPCSNASRSDRDDAAKPMTPNSAATYPPAP